VTGRARVGARWPGWGSVGWQLVMMAALAALSRWWFWFGWVLVIGLVKFGGAVLIEGAKALGLVVLDYGENRFRVRFRFGPSLAMVELAELTEVAVEPRSVLIRGLYLRRLSLPLLDRTAEQERWGPILVRAARAQGLRLNEADEHRLSDRADQVEWLGDGSR
jgi:hypothetical protein